MTFKVLCSDLDGTLLSTKSDVSEVTIAEIERIRPTTRIILVSARMPKAMTYIQERLGIEKQPIICYNGALVLAGTRVVTSQTVDFTALQEVYRLSEAHSIKLGLYYANEWYVEDRSERVDKEIRHTRTQPLFRSTSTTLDDWQKRNISAHKIMLMATQEAADAIYPVLLRSFDDHMNIYRSNDTLIEISPKAVSKIAAIEQLLNSDESLGDVIAFGDNYNDLSMLEQCGCGVAVGNARSSVKAVADHITLKNSEHGVAHFISQHL